MNQSYRIHVASRETGQEEILHFIAETPDAAGEMANEKGWLVRKVEPAFSASSAAGHRAQERLISDLTPAELRSVICWGIVLAWLVISLIVGVLSLLVWAISQG